MTLEKINTKVHARNEYAIVRIWLVEKSPNTTAKSNVTINWYLFSIIFFASMCVIFLPPFAGTLINEAASIRQLLIDCKLHPSGYSQ